MLSGNVSYFFGEARVRPYVTGSVGVLRTESVNSLTVAGSTAVGIRLGGDGPAPGIRGDGIPRLA